jgi:hypothetical protein
VSDENRKLQIVLVIEDAPGAAEPRLDASVVAWGVFILGGICYLVVATDPKYDPKFRIVISRG